MKKPLLILLAALLALCLPGCGAASTPEPEQTPEHASLRVAVVSDIHYTGEGSYRYTGSFRAANDASGTGKQVELLPSLLDAFTAQMLREKPDVLLITGDLSFNGARVSHETLLAKLEPLREAGVAVLVLPGNHDIGSYALVFPDGEPEEAPSVSAEEFAALYDGCGYGGALSRDAGSLSYVFDTQRGVRFILLDTCFRYGTVYGRVGQETMDWLARELTACRAAGDLPLVAGHHNALVHNPLFAFGYTIDNGGELRELLMRSGVTLYLSGHLHPQSIAEEDGFFDVASESFAVYPHRWGLLELEGDSWRYTARETEVERWAQETGCADERLLHYRAWGRGFFTDAARAQAERSFSAVEDEALRTQLCAFFAEANVNYFMGVPSPAPEGALADALDRLGGRTALYLQLITGLPESLHAESRIG